MSYIPKASYSAPHGDNYYPAPHGDNYYRNHSRDENNYGISDDENNDKIPQPIPQDNERIQVQQRGRGLNDTDFATKVQEFGREWIVPRENFLCTTLKMLISAVHQFVVALFNSGLALFESFNDAALNQKCITQWKDLGKGLLFTGILAIGIISPTASKKAEEFIDEILNPPEVIPIEFVSLED